MRITDLFLINRKWDARETVLYVHQQLEDDLLFVGTYFEMPHVIRNAEVQSFWDNEIEIQC